MAINNTNTQLISMQSIRDYGMFSSKRNMYLRLLSLKARGRRLSYVNSAQQDSCTELTEEMTGLLQVQARQNPSMKTGGWYEVLPITE